MLLHEWQLHEPVLAPPKSSWAHVELLDIIEETSGPLLVDCPDPFERSDDIIDFHVENQELELVNRFILDLTTT